MNQDTPRRRLLLIGAIVGVFVILATLFVIGYRKQFGGESVELQIWGIFDDDVDIRPLLEGFRKTNPDARISFRSFSDPIVYEQQLVDALAAGTGPDIFMFHDTWLPKHYDKVFPLPEEKLPYLTFQGLFPQVVEQDFTANRIVYALPLSVDTLALVYNRDDFNSAAIPLPPRTWDEFESVVVRLRRVNPATNQIQKAAAAIGGSARSINRATDLLSLLMLQTGTEMTTQDFSRATFADPATREGVGFAPGREALEFYTQFANPRSPYYTWNETLHYSIDNFQEAGVSIIFNYAYQLPQLIEKNPFLNLAIAPMPQPKGQERCSVGIPCNFPNYWGLAVSNQTKAPDAAFAFVIGVTTNEDIMEAYAEETQKPPALLALINTYVTDPDLGVFAKQALTARSWPQIDNVKIEEIFSTMIQSVISGRVQPLDALEEAENAVNILMRQRAR